MTPSVFFRAVSWFAAVVGIVMGLLGLRLLLAAEVLPALLCLASAAFNAVGWRLFHKWSRRM